MNYSEGLLRMSIFDGVGHLIIDRPEHRNALTSQMWSDIPRACDWFKKRNLEFLLLTGRGNDFGIGADLDDVLAATTSQLAADSFCFSVVRALLAVANSEIPVGAVMQGVAVGGSLELALAADFRVIVATSRIIFPFARLGIVPDRFTVGRLDQLVGQTVAPRLLNSTTPLDAQEAKNLGLVDAVAENLEEAVHIATSLRARERPCKTSLRLQAPQDLAMPMAKSFVTKKVRLGVENARRAKTTKERGQPHGQRPQPAH